MSDHTETTCSVNTNPFSWGKIKLSQTVQISGIPHMTRKAIGEWLEYPDPQKAIDKILERNPHVDHYSAPVNLTATDGKNYDTKVYHPMGFMLIAMESGQPKAKAMKVAVAEFVWHFAGPRRLTAKEEMELMKLHRMLTNDAAAGPDGNGPTQLTLM